MPIFLVTSGAVLLGTASPTVTDAYCNGVLVSASGALNRASASSGAQYVNGIFCLNDGPLQYVDATAGLPSDVVWQNGIPKNPSGAICVSTDAASTYSNGLPFVANGALAVGIIP